MKRCPGGAGQGSAARLFGVAMESSATRARLGAPLKAACPDCEPAAERHVAARAAVVAADELNEKLHAAERELEDAIRAIKTNIDMAKMGIDRAHHAIGSLRADFGSLFSSEIEEWEESVEKGKQELQRHTETLARAEADLERCGESARKSCSR
jgi:chromosome segregation ATPase